MNRKALLPLVALPLFAACAAGAGSGSGGSGSGNGGGGGVGVTTGTDTLPDAGDMMDAAPDAPMDLDGAAEAGTCALVKPYSSKDVDCNDCAEAKCCAEVNACLLDPDCDDGYVNCAIVCALEADAGGTDPACLAECAKQYPKGAMEYDAAIGCVDAGCATECQ